MQICKQNEIYENNKLNRQNKNQLSKFRAKVWVEITNDKNTVYAANKNVKLKTLMLKCSLCDYRDAQIYLLKEPYKQQIPQMQMRFQVIPI